jgi:hypothetical protein
MLSPSLSHCLSRSCTRAIVLSLLYPLPLPSQRRIIRARSFRCILSGDSVIAHFYAAVLFCLWKPSPGPGAIDLPQILRDWGQLCMQSPLPVNPRTGPRLAFCWLQLSLSGFVWCGPSW